MRNNGRLAVWIGGREALPVRAIPYVTGSPRFSPKVLAGSFAGRSSSLARKWTLTPYHLAGDTFVPIRTREWDMVEVSLDRFEAQRPRQFQRHEFSMGIMQEAARRDDAAAKLPAGAFVWLNELENEFQVDRESVIFCKERSDDAQLTLSPILDADTRAMVMEGFKGTVQEQPADTPIAGKTENVSSKSASGNDWKAQARVIADECFDADTRNGCRDSLKGYSERVMDFMQERGIKGSRGIINNANYIMRETLQGDKWWKKKSK